jgi:lactate dehydrogenase-like 2-hydroxyacid dehydrogenase
VAPYVPRAAADTILHGVVHEHLNAFLAAAAARTDGVGTVIPDDVIQRLVSFPNVIVIAHQAFFTREALGTILETTLASISDFAAGRTLVNEISAPR